MCYLVALLRPPAGRRRRRVALPHGGQEAHRGRRLRGRGRPLSAPAAGPDRSVRGLRRACDGRLAYGEPHARRDRGFARPDRHRPRRAPRPQGHRVRGSCAGPACSREIGWDPAGGPARPRGPARASTPSSTSAARASATTAGRAAYRRTILHVPHRPDGAARPDPRRSPDDRPRRPAPGLGRRLLRRPRRRGAHRGVRARRRASSPTSSGPGKGRRAPAEEAGVRVAHLRTGHRHVPHGRLLRPAAAAAAARRRRPARRRPQRLELDHPGRPGAGHRAPADGGGLAGPVNLTAPHRPRRSRSSRRVAHASCTAPRSSGCPASPCGSSSATSPTTSSPRSAPCPPC